MPMARCLKNDMRGAKSPASGTKGSAKGHTVSSASGASKESYKAPAKKTYSAKGSVGSAMSTKVGY